MNAWTELIKHFEKEPVENIYAASTEELQQEVLRLRATMILAEEEFVSSFTYDEHVESCDNARRIISEAIPPRLVHEDLKWEKKGSPELRGPVEKALRSAQLHLVREAQALGELAEKLKSGG